MIRRHWIRLPPTARRVVITFLLLALLGTVGWLTVRYYGTSRERYFVVDARTNAAEVTITGDALGWHLEDAVLCNRREARLSNPPVSDPPPLCNPVTHEETEAEVAEVPLRDGTELRVGFRPDGTLEIRRLDDGAALDLGGGLSLGEDDRLLLPPNAWRRAGGLLFQGNLTIGAEPASGTTHYLIEGSYDVREELPRATEPPLVKSGALRRGDIVEFRLENSDETIGVRGFLSPALDEDLAGFHVLAVTSPTRGRLVVTSFGSGESFGVRAVSVLPTWMDKAIADPVALGLAAVLGLTLAVLGLLLAAYQLIDLEKPP